MAWTTPKTWTAEVLTSSDMNTHLRDNLDALKNPPTDDFTTTADESTTSATFVDVDATDWSLDITPAGTEVWIFARLNVTHTTTGDIYFDIIKDGTTLASGGETNGIAGVTPGASDFDTVDLIYRWTGLTANTAVNFKLQWRTSVATASIGGTNFDSWWAVREMS